MRLFADYDFEERNPVSKSNAGCALTSSRQRGLEKETVGLERFYRDVRIRAEECQATAEGKQKIVAELYERFFKGALPDEVVQIPRHRLYTCRGGGLYRPQRGGPA